MAFDEALAERIRLALKRKRNIEEKKMFGGLGFLLKGNMLVGVWKTSLIVRMEAEDCVDALREPFVKAFDITGKAMKGWLLIEAEGVSDEAAVKDWVERAMQFVKKLPAKE